MTPQKRLVRINELITYLDWVRQQQLEGQPIDQQRQREAQFQLGKLLERHYRHR